jgi:hypothetical protein
LTLQLVLPVGIDDDDDNDDTASDAVAIAVLLLPELVFPTGMGGVPPSDLSQDL